MPRAPPDRAATDAGVGQTYVTRSPVNTPASVRALRVPPANVIVLLSKPPASVPHARVPSTPRNSIVPVPSKVVAFPTKGPCSMSTDRIT